jgi:hypothetical protein
VIANRFRLFRRSNYSWKEKRKEKKGKETRMNSKETLNGKRNVRPRFLRAGP